MCNKHRLGVRLIENVRSQKSAQRIEKKDSTIVFINLNLLKPKKILKT
jgi:hypothetical protein